MVEFLKTTGVSHYLEELVDNAQDKLILISPYLQINDRIKEQLEEKNRMKIDVRIVYGKNELQPEENNWLKDLDFITSSYCENLHAKCYLNNKEAIITSMNLYEFSQVNNNEMGIHVKRDEDPDIYNDIKEEANRLIRVSDEIEISVEKKPSKSIDDEGDKGYCIRCKEEIELDPTTPYCSDCFSSWNKYKNVDYEEKHCHICGKEMKSTRNKPVCYGCYKENKDDLDFPEKDKKSGEKDSTSEREEKGYCIRCEKEIELDPTSPYCSECYETWSEYGNEEYEEDHCHICGKEMDSTKKKPVCYSCYKEYKNELKFPGG